MTIAFFGLLFGLGALLVLTAQPHGAPKPTLATRLAARRPTEIAAQPEVREPVFRTRLFEELLRPSIERAGAIAAGACARAGLNLATTEERLRLTGDTGGLTLFVGQKLAAMFFGFAVLPAFASFGSVPPTPALMWLGMGVVGFVMPDLLLRSRAQAHRRARREELVRFAEMLSLAVSSGLGLEGGLDQVASVGDCELFATLRRVLRDGNLRGQTAARSLLRLPAEIGLAEAEPLVTALSTAASQGAPIIQALGAQVRALRERRRFDLIEGGERAQIRMLLPIGLLILPAFFMLMLYPAAQQLLRVTQG